MLLTIFGAVLLVLGLAIGWYGLRQLVVLPNLLRTEPITPSAVSAEDSFVVCQGTARVAESTIAGPFTGTRCLGFEFEVSERQPFHNFIANQTMTAQCADETRPDPS